jgi:hypothetical protein
VRLCRAKELQIVHPSVLWQLPAFMERIVNKSMILAAAIIAASASSTVLAKGGGGSHSGRQPSTTNTTAHAAVGRRQYKPIKVITPAARDITVNKARTQDKAYKSIQEYIRQ